MTVTVSVVAVAAVVLAAAPTHPGAGFPASHDRAADSASPRCVEPVAPARCVEPVPPARRVEPVPPARPVESVAAARPGPPPQETPAEEDEGLSGEVEFGVVSTSGNTETRTWNLNGGLGWTSGDWSHEGSLRWLRSSDEEGTTADRTLLRGETRRTLGERDFVFGAVRYERDRFGGFDYRVTERVGYGRVLLIGEPLAWEVEAGAGSRQSRELVGEGDGATASASTTEFIGSAATALTWTLSDTARVTGEMLVDAGSEGTVSHSITALTADLVSGLALRLSFDAKHTSEVPAGRDRLDTITSATLVYSFE